jgi:dihydrofolate reductase
MGGGELLRKFDDAGLLDRIILGMCPVTLGAGAPLLPRRITSERMRVTDIRLEAQQVRIVLDLERKTVQPDGPSPD